MAGTWTVICEWTKRERNGFSDLCLVRLPVFLELHDEWETKRRFHRFLSPSGSCRVCDCAVVGFCCPQSTVCGSVVHLDCCTQYEIDSAVCYRCIPEVNYQMRLLSVPAWRRHCRMHRESRKILRTSEVTVDQHVVYVETVALDRISQFRDQDLRESCQQCSLV